MEYTATARIKWEGQVREPGARLALPEDVAAGLLALGRIAPADPAAKGKAARDPDPDPDPGK